MRVPDIASLSMHRPTAAPFSTDYLLFVDSLRVLSCMLAAAVFGFYLIQAFTNKRLDRRDRGKSCGLCLVMCIIFFTEVGRMGHEITWRLEITIPALILLVWA